MTQLSDQERLSWLRLTRTDTIGPATFHKLIKRYKTATRALEELPKLTAKAGGARGLTLFPIEKAEREIAACHSFGARLVAFGEADYPLNLMHIDGAPPLLCMAGQIDHVHRESVGIVGARTASASGRKMARILAHGLAEAGILVTSGLARGIDTAAHEAAGPHRTAAVIAGGIDHRYPPENSDLQNAIARDGLLMTEMAIGTAPRAEHFPRRNRIISGMSRAVIVVEAALRSGSLITARFANEQGRDVFAVPGSPLDPRCEGTNKLIREGAILLTSVDELLHHLQQQLPPEQSQLFEPDDEPLLPPDEDADDASRREVLSLLSANAIEVDDLIREANCSPETVMAILLELEGVGKLVRSKGGRVALNNGTI